MGLTVNRLAFTLTPNSTMETSGAKRKIEQDSENVTRNEIVIEDN